MHRSRFEDILRTCRAYVPDPYARVLDIGRSELTAYLSSFYRDVRSLGFDTLTDDGGHREISEIETIPHIPFDLLGSYNVLNWPHCGCFDLIVFSEVVEHLAIAPEFVFAGFSALLAEGGVLICTTPNASDVAKRIRLMFGRNPYERLRLYSSNPGHIREYTRRELCDIANSVGFVCKSHAYRNWISNAGANWSRSIVAKLFRLYPPFRPFQICVFTRSIS